MEILVQKADWKDALHVASNLRQADFHELTVSRSDQHPVEMIMESFDGSDWCYSVKVDGVPTLIYGLHPSPDPKVGIAWMVATDGIASIDRKFVRGCRDVISKMLDVYPLIFNLVHRDNAISIRWLKWLGFSIDTTPTGPSDAFLYFWMGNKNV